MLLQDKDYQTFLNSHKAQFEHLKVPDHFWYTVYSKLKEDVFDIGNVISLFKIEYDDDDEKGEYPVHIVNASTEVSADDPNNIYLIDHAWTFRPESVHDKLSNDMRLRKRLAAMTGASNCDDVTELTRKLWRYCCYYTLGNAFTAEERVPIWYVMDEVGSAVNHSDEPNVRILPFFYLPDGVPYSLLFPIRDIGADEQLRRDFIEGVSDETARNALLSPWKPDLTFKQYDFKFAPVSDEYFASGHDAEILSDVYESPQLEAPIKVFSEYKYIHEYLTDPRFVMCDYECEADVLWPMDHFKNFKNLRPNTFVNQFPYEYVITIKDLLAITARNNNKEGLDFDPVTLEAKPAWTPCTFNLKTELVPFLSYYERRQELGLDNHWIIKPFNLARGLDTHITSDVNCVVRLAYSGPKIVQKYIEKPILFDRPGLGEVKFDIRYVLLLKSIRPLKVYAYRNFFLRFANKPFRLDNLHEYEQHFTVMNYKNPQQLQHMRHDDFISTWNKIHPDCQWLNGVEPRIFEVFREIFECATKHPPPRGLADCKQSRSVYAVDLMLEKDSHGVIQPKLLEINYTPDCQRACEYYNDFYNDIFKLLFCDVENSAVFLEL